MFVSPRRDTAAARRFFERAIGTTRVLPIEVTTDRAAAYPAVLDDLLPATWHRTDQDANNRIECDHGRVKARLRPMRGRKQDRSATVVLAGHALVQNLRRRHYELAVEEPAAGEWRSHSTNWFWRSDPLVSNGFGISPVDQMQQSPAWVCGLLAASRWTGAKYGGRCRAGPCRPPRPPAAAGGNHPLLGIIARRDLLRLIALQAAPDAATSQRLRPTPP